MKNLLFLSLLIADIVFAQYPVENGIIQFPPYSQERTTISSSYVVDTVVYEAGDSLEHITILASGLRILHEDHVWVYADAGRSYSLCAVAHGPQGCPDGWFKGYRICSECLRKEYVREIRTAHKVLSEYEKLNQQVERAKNK